MELITTKKALLEALEAFSDSDKIVVEVHDTVLNEGLYGFYIDPIEMGLDENGKKRGYEVRLCPVEYNPQDVSEIDEDDEVKFKKYNDLSYKDSNSTHVLLFVKDELFGQIKVFLDSGMDNREYVCINHEIIYLDTLKSL